MPLMSKEIPRCETDCSGPNRFAKPTLVCSAIECHTVVARSVVVVDATAQALGRRKFTREEVTMDTVVGDERGGDVKRQLQCRSTDVGVREVPLGSIAD